MACISHVTITVTGLKQKNINYCKKQAKNLISGEQPDNLITPINPKMTENNERKTLSLNINPKVQMALSKS